MLFFRELKKVCFSMVYVVFLGLLLFSWYENFYGVTEQEIKAAKNGTISAQTGRMEPSILRKPSKEDPYYGSKQGDGTPERIMMGAADWMHIEYMSNSYATYPYGYYKEVKLDEKDQKKIRDILSEITGLTGEQLKALPKDYFPTANGNIFHSGAGSLAEDGSYVIEHGKSETAQFCAQVSYEQFWELMKQAEGIIGRGSNYSMENLKLYFGQEEMDYEEAMEEYKTNVYEEKVSPAFARLFCDYLASPLGLYPVLIAVAFCIKDRRDGIQDLVDSKSIRTGKLLGVRFAAMLTAVMLPVILLSLESLFSLLRYSVETGFAVDWTAFAAYILWWLCPSVMAVLSIGMFITIWTETPLAVAIQGIWWFVDRGLTGLSGDVKPWTLMVRHNTLGGSELIRENVIRIWQNRGVMLLLCLVFWGLSCVVYEKRRKGAWKYAFWVRKHMGFFKN